MRKLHILEAEVKVMQPQVKMMLKLKFQYFGHLMQKANPLERTLRVEKMKGSRTRG